jgi:ABC-type amino acid transport substrate-binding protein
MRKLTSSFAAIVVAGLAGAPLAWAQDKFFKEATPAFENCNDGSLAKAMKDGVTLGFSPIPPHSWINAQTKEAEGIDVEIHKAALDWIGIKQFKIEWMPWESQVPALLSKRTDLVAGNIHVNPERIKVISFTGPAWWYGPVLLVQKGNPDGIKTYEDLKGKQVGAVSGSAAEAYLRRIGVETTTFKSENEELQSLNAGRLKAALEDDVVYLVFEKESPNNRIQPLWDIATPDDIIYGGGYGYARYALRKEDCSLRAAYTQALAEIRGNGHVSAILKKHGLGDRNLFWFKLNP